MNYIIRFIIIFVILNIIFSVFNFYNTENQWNSINNSTGILTQTRTYLEPRKTEHKDFINNIKPLPEKISTDFPGNYIDRAISYGHLYRWHPDTFPLKVYIENNPELPDYYYKEVKKAFMQWQKVSGDYITFVYTDFKDEADIRCTFPKNFDREISDDAMTAGLSSFEINNDLILYSKIELAVYNSKNKYLKPKQLYHCALHEIGHSLGLKGHSANPNDIMYPSAKHYKAKISLGDISTLRLLYSIIPDISNKNFSQEDKQNLLKASEILGDYDERRYIELRNTKEDIENSRVSTDKVSKIADLYYLLKNYEAAAQNYKKLLLSVDDIETKSSIYYNLALSYKNLDNYDEALKAAQQAYRLDSNSDKAALLAKLYYDTGDYKSAQNLAIHVLEVSPKTYNMYIVLGQIYKAEKNWKEMEALADKAKLNFPENPPIYRTE